jgi:hypothetical protein
MQGYDMRSRVLMIAAGCLMIAGMIGTVGTAPAAVDHHMLPERITVAPGVIPDVIRNGTELTYTSYMAALEMPEVLASVPCTCGCMETIEHRNNLDCYVERIYPDGSVTFTTHGIGCGICQLITRDAVEGAAMGMSAEDLHAMILERYGPRQN